jgi:hypothetical protein
MLLYAPAGNEAFGATRKLVAHWPEDAKERPENDAMVTLLLKRP